MKKIAIITATRAEFGLLLPVIKALRKYESFELKIEVIVTGTHFYPEFGTTIEEIRSNDIRIDKEIKIPVESKTASNISKNQAITLEKFTKLFLEEHYTGIVILGDRYEMLAIAIAAGNTQTPIFHLCGGDTTEGAMDEWIRHSITKMSYLHFPTNEESYQRILQLGEAPNRVFNYGSTSIDNIKNLSIMSKQEVLKSMGFQDCPYAICTYHPVTIEHQNLDMQMKNFLNAMKTCEEIEFIVTKANADQGGFYINQILEKAEKEMKNLHVVSSLGVVRYLSFMKYAEFVLGNSSSGIIEAPALGVPTINIGDRQRGRLQAESILNCKSDTKSILEAIAKVMDTEFKQKCQSVRNPYGDGHTAEKIAKKIVEVVEKETIDLKKRFYNIEDSR